MKNKKKSRGAMIASLTTQRRNLLRGGANKNEVNKLYRLSNTSSFSNLNDKELTSLYNEIKSYGKLSVMHESPYSVESKDGLIRSSTYEENAQRYRDYKKRVRGITSTVEENVSINKAKNYIMMKYNTNRDIHLEELETAKRFQAKIFENLTYVIKHNKRTSDEEKKQYNKLVKKLNSLKPEQFLKFYYSTKENKINYDELVKDSPKTLNMLVTHSNEQEELLTVANNRLVDIDKELSDFTKTDRIFGDRK